MVLEGSQTSFRSSFLPSRTAVKKICLEKLRAMLPNPRQGLPSLAANPARRGSRFWGCRVQSEGILPEFWKGLGALRVGAMAGVAAVLTGFFLYIFGVIAEPP